MNTSRSQLEGYFFGNPEKIANKILFIKRNTRLSEYREKLTDVYEFGNIWQGITGTFRGELLTIIVAGVGPSLIGDAVYALNRPSAVCLYSGTCGGLDESIEIGDYFVAESALCGDGYTLQFGYQPFTEIPGDVELSELLTSSFITKGENVKKGVTFTTSSVVREADSDFWGKVHKSCQIIDMACAPFYAAAKATGMRAAAYFWVTDLPTRGKSFFDALCDEDLHIKQTRYEHSVTLDLELLSAL